MSRKDRKGLSCRDGMESWEDQDLRAEEHCSSLANINSGLKKACSCYPRGPRGGANFSSLELSNIQTRANSRPWVSLTSPIDSSR